MLGGPGGSGRSTLAQSLISLTGFNHLYGGAIQRSLSVQHGFGETDPNTNQLVFSEASFIRYHQEYVSNHPEIDLQIDLELFKSIYDSSVIIESMTFAPLAKRIGIPSLKIWVTADEEIRVHRLIERERKAGRIVDAKEMSRLLRTRTDANQRRYQALYGFDYLHVGEYYDFTFDTSSIPEERMADELYAQIKKRNYL